MESMSQSCLNWPILPPYSRTLCYDMPNDLGLPSDNRRIWSRRIIFPNQLAPYLQAD
jgi:hypothetical protein